MDILSKNIERNQIQILPTINLDIKWLIMEHKNAIL